MLSPENLILLRRQTITLLVLPCSLEEWFRIALTYPGGQLLNLTLPIISQNIYGSTNRRKKGKKKHLPNLVHRLWVCLNQRYGQNSYVSSRPSELTYHCIDYSGVFNGSDRKRETACQLYLERCRSFTG